MGKIGIISDTHTYHEYIKIPDALDMILCAGDISINGETWEVKNFMKWFSKLAIPHKVFICGNHELQVYKANIMKSLANEYTDITYLEHESKVVNGLKIFGSPYTPEFFNWAWMYPRERGGLIWSAIPMDSDVVITHGPPASIFDKVKPFGKYQCENAGCYYLKAKIDLIKPKLHCFGHLHNNYNHKKINGTLYVNAATCNEAYVPKRKPVVIDTDMWDVVDSSIISDV